MEEHGVFSLPVVSRVGDEWKLIAGHDRVAALMRVKAKDALCIVVAGDERSLRRLSVAENLYRRHDDKAELLRLIDSAEEVAAEDLADKRPVIAQRGKPKTARGAAREAVAKASGKSPEAVRKAEARAKVTQQPNAGATADAGEAPTVAPAATPIDDFDLLGTSPPLAFIERVRAVCAVIDEADQYLRLAQGKTTALASMQFPNALQQRLKQDVHHAAAALRMARPCMVCPWCKTPEVASDKRKPCLPCDTKGYIVEEQRGGVPPELLVPGVVAVNGKFVANFASDNSVGRVGVDRNGKRIRIKTEARR